ncbi:hypothetical protein [Leptospira sp. GIMC2001]|uniref:hypothetical protein n=1 Tax=Leptospira sp. GIMC2001 TaxID=1513297 RepID=UPI00234BC06A|nr:hypothetical protein [Leptospira sp. GIMC2001]WCL50031.1 hypothetical protein O4O04_04210 [Leptospira sp. GIMC2001]
MAKAGKTDKIVKHSNQEIISLGDPRLQILDDIFFRPHFAFESFQNREVLGGRDLWKLHLWLSLLAPISKIIHNSAKAIVQFFRERTIADLSEIVSGAATIWFIYIGMIVFIRFADVFRVYYRKWETGENWNPPPPWVLLVGFIPFTASGIFFLLPTPINLFLVAIAFIYCLHLSFQALKNLNDFSNKDFLSFLLQFFIFLSFFTAIVFGSYNILRTIRP